VARLLFLFYYPDFFIAVPALAIGAEKHMRQ
jgi:hypothetical protein